MSSESLWIVGSTRSGKTQRLVEQVRQWRETWGDRPPSKSIVVFAANGENRLALVERLQAVQGAYALESHTPLGFLQREVLLFWPLLAHELKLSAQFPLRLRPETEQELATRCWQTELDEGRLHQEGVRDYMMVRRTLDIWQLAAVSGVTIADLPDRLAQGLGPVDGSLDLWDCIGDVLRRWRRWCLERGLLTYGLVADLYGQVLLPHPTYQHHLSHRYCGLLADDVDDFPAIAFPILNHWLDHGIPAALTFHPQGAVRLGLGADPDAMAQLAQHCTRTEQLGSTGLALGDRLGPEQFLQWMSDPLWLELPDVVQSIQTVARGSLLRDLGEYIGEAIATEQVAAQDVAIIGPGLDAIARYTLREILNRRGIELVSLQDQRPLVSYPMVRSLLVLMALVYPGLGRLLQPDAIAEMLVVLSQNSPTASASDSHATGIDPVRAGLLVDHCFVPDLTHPHFLPANTFSRWDRLGYQATQGYEAIRDWIHTQQQQIENRLLPNAIALLDRAIQHFFQGGSHLPYDQLTALRELMETAQHYWDAEQRLQQTGAAQRPDAAVVGQFIDLLQSGTITADPYPLRQLGRSRSAVTLSTIFQYRSQRCAHRWQFWLDAGSELWLTGGGPLLGAPLFLKGWNGQPWTVLDSQADDQARLARQLADLLGRVSDRLILCHSDLSTTGQEQAGPLLPIVNAAIEVSRTSDNPVKL